MPTRPRDWVIVFTTRFSGWPPKFEAAPQLHRPWRHGTRRHFDREFPYALIYVERPDRIMVLAVAHFKRRPDYWRERLK